jgi:hypothetical protein
MLWQLIATGIVGIVLLAASGWHARDSRERPLKFRSNRFVENLIEHHG